jgi:hypothetical protein
MGGFALGIGLGRCSADPAPTDTMNSKAGNQWMTGKSLEKSGSA